MSHQESSELAEPCVGPLDDPAAFVAAQFPSVLVAALLVVLSIRAINSMPLFFSRSRKGSES